MTHYPFKYSDEQRINYPRLRFVRRLDAPGFGQYSAPNGELYTLFNRSVQLNAEGLKLNQTPEGKRVLKRQLSQPVDMVGDVTEFHLKFGLDYDGPPRKLEETLNTFREKFIWEEAIEFRDAESDAKKFDACMDLIYVVIGYCLLRGWDINEGWRRVQAANMNKRHATKDEVIKGIARHESDIRKPDGWEAPNHSDLV